MNLHTVLVHHSDSGHGGFGRTSKTEVVTIGADAPLPPTSIEWGHVERYNGHVEHHSAPVACTWGVRYTDGLASCLRAWGCRVARVLATSSEESEAAALVLELAPIAA